MAGIVQPPLGLVGHDFAGGYKFPVRGRRKREAALRELRRMASWDHNDLQAVDFISTKDGNELREMGPERIKFYVRHLSRMLREACARAAKYQVAAEAMAHRLDKTEARRR